MLYRARLLYIIQFLVLLLALVVRSFSARPAALPSPDTVGGWGNALFLIATLQLPAPNLTILPMYVVLLLAAVGCAYGLRAGKGWLVLAISAAVYVVSLIIPEYTVLPYLRMDPADQFNWSSWQFPFVIAFTVGWFWQQKRLRELVLSKRVVLPSAAVFVILYLSAQVVVRAHLLEGSNAEAAIKWVFRKFDIGPGVIIFGVSALILLYWVVVHLIDRPLIGDIIRTVLVTVGQRSLDSFVILCIALIILPAALPYSSGGIVGMVSAVVVFAACWVWAYGRKARKKRPAPVSEEIGAGRN